MLFFCLDSEMRLNKLSLVKYMKMKDTEIETFKMSFARNLRFNLPLKDEGVFDLLTELPIPVILDLQRQNKKSLKRIKC